MPRQYTITPRPVIYPLGPSIAYLPLTQGLYALIDAEDGPLVGQYNWQAMRAYRSRLFYVGRGYWDKQTKSFKTLGLHKLLNTDYKDHINGDTLDNRRCNLRKATVSENACNTALWSNNKSGYKGVSYDSENNLWRANVTFQKKSVLSKRFKSKIEAIEAVRDAHLKYHGEFVRRNQNVKVREVSDDVLQAG